jgi:hypothetical protein
VLVLARRLFISISNSLCQRDIFIYVFLIKNALFQNNRNKAFFTRNTNFRSWVVNARTEVRATGLFRPLLYFINTQFLLQFKQHLLVALTGHKGDELIFGLHIALEIL